MAAPVPQTWWHCRDVHAVSITTSCLGVGDRCTLLLPALFSCPQEEFLENLHKAAGALQALVPQVIEFIAGKRYSDL